MNKRLTRRLDKALLKIGLIRAGAVPAITYDFVTKEIHMQVADQCVHGYVCPTPDGPLKKRVHSDWDEALRNPLGL